MRCLLFFVCLSLVFVLCLLSRIVFVSLRFDVWFWVLVLLGF